MLIETIEEKHLSVIPWQRFDNKAIAAMLIEYNAKTYGYTRESKYYDHLINSFEVIGYDPSKIYSCDLEYLFGNRKLFNESFTLFMEIKYNSFTSLSVGLSRSYVEPEVRDDKRWQFNTHTFDLIKSIYPKTQSHFRKTLKHNTYFAIDDLTNPEDLKYEVNYLSALEMSKWLNLNLMTYITLDMDHTLFAIRHLKNNYHDMLNFFTHASKTNKHFSIISPSKMTVRSKLSFEKQCNKVIRNLKNIHDILDNKIALDNKLWEILRNNNAWVTGGIMSTLSNDNNYSVNDIDIMCSKENYKKLLLSIKSQYNVIEDKIINSELQHNNLTIVHNDNRVLIDIFVYHDTPELLLKTFHFGCVRAAYNGKKFICLPSYITSLTTMTNCDIRYVASSTTNSNELIYKYNNRGYAYISMPWHLPFAEEKELDYIRMSDLF